MAEGHIKLYRRLLDSALWTGQRFTSGQAWVDLLLRANHRDSTIRRGPLVIPIARGQVFTSQMALAARWHWNRMLIAAWLKEQKASNRIDIRACKATSTGYTIITILNYRRYQGSDSGDQASDRASDEASDRARLKKLKQYKDSFVVVQDSPPKTDPEFIASEARKLKERFAVAAARAQP